MRVRLLNILGTVLLALSQWGQVILLTRLLGVYEVGLFSYFLALTGPLVLFSRFMLSVLVPTQKKLSYDYQVFHQFRMLTNVSFLLFSSVLMLSSKLSFYESACLGIFVLFKFFENKEEFIYTENIAESNIAFLAYSKIYKSILTLALFTVITVTFNSLLFSISSLLVAQWIIYYFYDRRYSYVLKQQKVKLEWLQFKNIVGLGIGLTAVEVLNSFVTNIPRYMIEHFHGIETLGIFATIMYFSTITNNVVVAINETFVASLAKTSHSNIALFYRSFLRLCMMFLILVGIGEIILLLFGNRILVFVYGEQFEGFQQEMMLLGILLFLVVYIKLFEMALSILNIYRLQVILQSSTFVLTLVLSIAVIIPFGLKGAFIVAIITHSMLATGQLAVLVHHWRTKDLV
ncbi:lipopolysaccharide biosynthesis protein [Salinicoccus sesuvii]|uniref:Lipopolysaccharide biosynthesis protein n=1 Tax=Salinicoccus sesuvii TaxID=868281 RepID=A0ABV7N8T6_9STAP